MKNWERVAKFILVLALLSAVSTTVEAGLIDDLWSKITGSGTDVYEVTVVTEDMKMSTNEDAFVNSWDVTFVLGHLRDSIVNEEGCKKDDYGCGVPSKFRCDLRKEARRTCVIPIATTYQEYGSSRRKPMTLDVTVKGYARSADEYDIFSTPAPARDEIIRVGATERRPIRTSREGMLKEGSVYRFPIFYKEEQLFYLALRFKEVNP